MDGWHGIDSVSGFEDDTRSQGISSQGIDPVLLEYPCLAPRRVDATYMDQHVPRNAENLWSDIVGHPHYTTWIIVFTDALFSSSL